MIRGDNAIGVQVDGDNNCVTIYVGASRLVLNQPHRRRGTVAPANERQLLLTELRSTTLVGRDNELACLDQWRASAARVGVRCIIGRAGSGKSRLGIEACERAEAEGWVAGFASGDELRRFHAAQSLAQWCSPQDTLVVIDDAASSAGILRDWFTILARGSGQEEGLKLRILLLDRYADPDGDYGWWADLKRSDDLVQAGPGDLIGAETPVPLPSIAMIEDRRALLAEVMCLAARWLDKAVLAPPAAGADEYFDRRLADDRLENEPLFLLMAGIVAAERGAPTALALPRKELAKTMAAVERARLTRFGESHGLPRDGDLMAHLAACATLQRGCTFDAAVDMVIEEASARGFPLVLPAEALVDLLSEALPEPAGDGIDRIRPDLIGEAFLIREVTGPKARTALQRFSIVERAYRRAEDDVTETLVNAAQDLAGGAEDHAAVVWLRALVGGSRDLDELIRIAGFIPKETLALRELSAELTGRIVDGLHGSPRDDEDAKPRLATFLADLSNRLSDLGDREEALAAAQEAAQLYRSLVASQPTAFTLDLAESLGTLANRLGALGRHEEALALAREGVDHLRTLAKSRPETVNPSLAMSLHNLANRLREVGKREEALDAGQEALNHFSDLAKARPDFFDPYVAITFNNLSRCYMEIDLWWNALTMAQCAVGLYRRLAEAQPDAFGPSLGMSLINLTCCYSHLDHDEEALAAAQEAVDLFGALATARPDAFKPQLGTAFNNVAFTLGQLERDEEALAATQEAVDIYRALAAQRPGVFAADLALALKTSSVLLANVGRGDDAVTIGQEGIDLLRPLAAARPDAFVPPLASSLCVLGDQYEVSGRQEEALASVHEAVELLAPYFLASPVMFGRAIDGYQRRYLRRAKSAGVAPDYDLLEPILRELESMDVDAC